MNLSLLTATTLLSFTLFTPSIAMADEFKRAAQEAGNAIDEANALNYEWRDSRKILQQANEAEAAGEHSEAMKLAVKARIQGMTAKAQAIREEKTVLRTKLVNI